MESASRMPMPSELFRRILSRKLAAWFGRSIVGAPWARTDCAPDLGRYTGVCFSLDHAGMMLGDALFFVPLVSMLKCMGVPVHVAVRSDAQFMFDGNMTSDLSGRWLVVSRDVFFSRCRGPRGEHCDRFLINTSHPGIDIPIADAVASGFFSHIGEHARSVELSDFANVLEAGKEVQVPIEMEKGSSALAPFLGSGFFRLSRADQRLLIGDFARTTNRGNRVLIGSAEDKGRRAGLDRLDFTWDLRGLLSPMQLVGLLAGGRIRTLHSHDTFVMHLGNLLGMEVRVVFRRFFRPGEAGQKRRAFLRLFERQQIRCTVLN